MSAKVAASAGEEPTYLHGFGNEFESEALPGALPHGQNNPQTCPYGLYAEQLSGTAFTAPRGQNQRTWLYRIRPSVQHSPFQEVEEAAARLGALPETEVVTPRQLRWSPFPLPERPTDFVSGLRKVCGAGSPELKDGYVIYMYGATADMIDSCLCNADGDFLIVPQQGGLRLRTELGLLHVRPGEICVLPRGLRWAAGLLDGAARGYVLEVFGGHFALPELGPIGANGLANPRDFQTPIAAFEDTAAPFTLFHKFGGRLFAAQQRFSPFNVVAWHGNYVPYKYDLARFCPVNAVAFDHSDPSIFTVLTCPSAIPGTAAADFVVFPPRWAVAERTFRPPYFHRNCMSEFMGCVRGAYDGKAGGFAPGGASLHSCMSPHGPDAGTFAAASTADLKPARLPDGLSFMFEVNCIPRVQRWALECSELQQDYHECWQGLQSHFTGGNQAAGGPKS